MRLTAISKAKITGSFGPGETVRIEVEMRGRMGGLIQARGCVKLEEGGEVMLVADVVLSGEERIENRE